MSSRALQMIIAFLVAASRTASASCEEGQCTTAPEQQSIGEARGLSLMQSGRSVMPSIDTKLLSLDLNDGLVDDFANMEDEFDEDSFQERRSSHVETASSTDKSAEAQSLGHFSNPRLYVETLLVIAFFAFAAKGFKRADTVDKAVASAKADTADKAKTPKTDSALPPPVIVQGGGKDFAALEQAVRAGDEGKCLELLKQGGRYAVRQEDPCGCTALHVAAHCGSASMARLLLNHGAKVDACEAWEETPLHIAARIGSVEVLEILLANGANMDAVNAHGMTPLLLAGHAKKEAVCEMLLARGAGAGGIADTELPPLVNSLIFRRMFVGAVPRQVPEVQSESETEKHVIIDEEDDFEE